MRFLIIPAILLLGWIARADVVTDWNEIALQAIQADKTSPPRASRALAIVHTSIFDAANGITQTHERYLVTGRPSGAASPEAAAAAAAHFALVRLFPAQQAAFDAAYARSLAAFPNSADKNGGVHWGEWVANVIVGARSADSSEESVGFTPTRNPGQWRPTPPKEAPALLPQWTRVSCFAMTSGAQFRPPRPPLISTAVYAFDLNLTKEIGALDSKTRTAEQTAIAKFWADGPGTVTPPGHWNVIARSVAAQRGTKLHENARLFALLNVALADGAILCWDCKYIANYWRPITAIREADTDGNPATEKDANWTPLLDTPPFPEYTSGHSTFSSAGAAVLAAFFGSDNIPFSASSEAFPGFSRAFNSFTEAAAEAGMSRIFGGIHFMSANQQGLQSGAKLGAYVVENFMKPRAVVASLDTSTTLRAAGEVTAKAAPPIFPGAALTQPPSDPARIVAIPPPALPQPAPQSTAEANLHPAPFAAANTPPNGQPPQLPASAAALTSKATPDVFVIDRRVPPPPPGEKPLPAPLLRQ